MIIVLLDEPGLFVFPSAAAAVQAIEPIDAESQIRAAFDHSGVPHRVEWLRPNRHRKRLFGFLHSVEPGEYRLVSDGPAKPGAFRELLERHLEHTDPPEAKADLESLLAAMRAV